jgi:hypothetical protein
MLREIELGKPVAATKARLSWADSESPAPLHGQLGRKSVGEALVGRDQLCFGLNGQGDINAVVDSPVVRESNPQSFRQQDKRRYGHDIASLEVCCDSESVVLCHLRCRVPFHKT